MTSYLHAKPVNILPEPKSTEPLRDGLGKQAQWLVPTAVITKFELIRKHNVRNPGPPRRFRAEQRTDSSPCSGSPATLDRHDRESEISYPEKGSKGAERMTVIELPDEQAAALKAKAAAQGLTLEAWFQKLALDAPAPELAASAMDWSQCPVVESIPGKVSGAWVLKGTRMPVSIIFENLEAGANIDDIMEWYAGLDRAQVEAVVEFAVRSLDKPPAGSHP
jgi:uncharacterized protein (DUF433 family)